jgi:hypothetical protein
LQGLLWLFPQGNTGAIVTADKISMQIETHKLNIIFEESSPLRVLVEITATGKVDEVSEITQESHKTRAELERLFAAAIEKEIRATANILQNKFNVDGYNLLETLRKKNYSLYKKHADNWHKTFPEIEILPRVTVKVA